MYPIAAGLIIETKETLAEIQRLMSDLSVRVVMEHIGIPDDWAGFLDRIDRVRPDVVLLEVARLREPLEDVIRRFRSTATQPAIFALHGSAEPEAILNALRSGASEYLSPPYAGPLKAALERVAAARAQASAVHKQGGKSIAFLSAKGGCGSTTLACHVAVELPRLIEGKVLLADLDLQTGMVGFLIKSKTQYSLADAANNLQRLDLSYWKAIISNGIPGLEVISAPAAPHAKEIPAAQIRQVLAFASQHYAYTVMDAGRNLHSTSLAALEMADETYLVTTPEIPALHGAKEAIRYLLEGGYPKAKLRLVLNRATRRLEVTLGELESMLGVPIFATVENDYQSLHEAYAEGKLGNPGSHAGQSFARLAAKIAGVEPKKKKFSLFG
ncbi:MAG TPA: AAA family ATPase [Bryobacteraceae bacterium]|nr:AAA family ATPase [Bryobacteraceae bacterium]